MTLLDSDEQPPVTDRDDVLDGSGSSWDALYSSYLWSNSHLRRAALDPSNANTKVVKYCYTCKGKIRKYEIKSPKDNFVPTIHSTPNGKITLQKTDLEPPIDNLQVNTLHTIRHANLIDCRNPVESTNIEVNHMNQRIPSISDQIDSSFRQRFTSYEIRPNEINRRRLRKSLKGIGCIVNLALTDSPAKKRTQIQACSISVMIVAILIISFVLVNFATPSVTRATTVASTNVVPTQNIPIIFNQTTVSSTESVVTTTTLFAYIISKIHKNVTTYSSSTTGPEDNRELTTSTEINRDLSIAFCSCQSDEVCMLQQNNGTSVCKKAVDIKDPTGCGGICALEIEACQLVDRVSGVRVCRLLSLNGACGADEWPCRDGRCVPAEARCDGLIQCYDRSDEMHCACDLAREFHCGHSMSCFPNTKLCDGIINCYDGFDEVNCTRQCRKEEFECTDGQCIPMSRFCDGLSDCLDASDEPEGCDMACIRTEMRCANSRCLPLSKRCDGRDDCGDGSDELQCSLVKERSRNITMQL